MFHAPDSIVSSNGEGSKILRFFVGEHKIQGNFQSRGSLVLNYGIDLNDVLINKMFNLGHYKNIKKIRKTINPIVETVKLCTSKYSTKRS